MRVICTPSHGPLAIIVDIESGKIVHEIPIPQEMAHLPQRPFGIARDHLGRWYIASREAIACLSPDFVLQYFMSGLPENIHQLHYDELGGELWVAATSIDSLLAINIDDKTVRRFCLNKDEWVDLHAPGVDTQHFNSVKWHGSKLYVLAHKFGTEPSCLTVYNRDMLRIGQWHVGREAHSICEYNGQIFVLDSRGGAIIGNRNTHIPVGDARMYQSAPAIPSAGAALLHNYVETENKHYTRGMVITPQGFAVVAIFDFGKIETRTTGDAILRVFDVKEKKQLREIVLPHVGNIQDIQLYDQPLVRIPSNPAFYAPVTDKLNGMISDIMAGKLDDPEIRIPYNPLAQAPDMANRLAQLRAVPIDFSVRNNLRRLLKNIEKDAEKILNEILPGAWERSGGFIYPAHNGWMDWHTNFEAPGPRIYLVWCAEGGKSRFYTSPDGKTVQAKVEPAGWSVNAFMIGGENDPFWHAVDSGGTDRISFGFKPKSDLYQFAIQ